MNNTVHRMHSGIGMSVVLMCLMAIAFGMQASSELPVQADPSSTSGLRFCYEAVQKGASQVQQQSAPSGRSGRSRRCGELAQFSAFDAKAPPMVSTQAPRNLTGDCLAGRRPTVRGSIHQSAFSRSDCENALNGTLAQPVERFWF